MRGAAQARVEGADHGFDAVERAFGELAVLDVCLCGLQDAHVHGVVVLAGGNDEVGPGNEAVLVDFVVMMEGAARSLGLACSFEAIDPGDGTDMLVEDEGVSKDMLDLFDAVKYVDKAGVVVVEGALNRTRGEVLEFDELLVGPRCSHGLCDVEAGEGTDAVAALGIPERLVVGELGVAIRLYGFADDFGEAVGIDAVFDDDAFGVDEAESAVSEFDGFVFVDEAEIVGWEVGEDFDFGFEGIGDLLVCGKREADVGVGLRESWQGFRHAWQEREVR